MRLNLPNLITTGRVAAAPAVAWLLLQPRPGLRIAAFALFLVAALSDLWDGYLARSRGEETSFGQIVDPLADKFLLLATLLPLYVLIGGNRELAGLPLFDRIPLWVVLVLLGRELVITVLRFGAARLGRVVPALELGKRKALAQNIFLGAAILWVAFRSAGVGEPAVGFWAFFRDFHGWFTTVFLIVALALTVVSLVTYLLAFSRIFAREYT